jgi:hypothetical protein
MSPLNMLCKRVLHPLPQTPHSPPITLPTLTRDLVSTAVFLALRTVPGTDRCSTNICGVNKWPRHEIFPPQPLPCGFLWLTQSLSENIPFSERLCLWEPDLRSPPQLAGSYSFSHHLIAFISGWHYLFTCFFHHWNVSIQVWTWLWFISVFPVATSVQQNAQSIFVNKWCCTPWHSFKTKC